MKILGLDVGEKRIGVALVDTSVKIAYPHSTIIADGTEVDQIKKIMSYENTKLVIIGMPRNSTGEKTAQSQIVSLFATRLESRGAKVKYQDESLTSVIAERRLKDRKKPYRREDIDKEAATIILQDFIESFPPSTGDRGSQAVHPVASKTTPQVEASQKETQSPSANKETTEPSPVFRAKELRSLVGPMIIVAVFVVLSCVSIWFASGTIAVNNNPIRRSFTIHQGESTSQIAESLKKAGLIKDPTVFTLSAYLTRASIPAKDHFISGNQTVWQVLDQLTSN